MRHAFSLQPHFRLQNPGRCRWAGMNYAFGVKTHDERVSWSQCEPKQRFGNYKRVNLRDFNNWRLCVSQMRLLFEFSWAQFGAPRRLNDAWA